ncbi:alpha/beta fold hydrolase [Magnetococcus sp. PR-3]|uniref:alpha/beta fold hydrolase n=1 Tax=Magnetococcus sp. PR-3 TaxID=3120355 RepID=UPI002FCDE283
MTLWMMHGWGLGRGVWRPMLHHFGGYPTLKADMGFFHPQGQASITQPEGAWIGVGHSMGSLWLLKSLMGEAETPEMEAIAKVGNQCKGLIFINGFSRFHQGRDFPHGVGIRVIGRMRKQLPVDAAQVLKDFGSRSGMPPMDLPSMAIPHPPQLDWGLEAISRWDGRDLLAQWDRPFKAIASREDAIVTPMMSEAMFTPQQLQWVEGASHLLPLTHGQQMAAAINTSLESWL